MPALRPVNFPSALRPLWLRFGLSLALSIVAAGEPAPVVAVMPLLATVPVLTEAPEYNTKAGYLLLFTRYVEWPAATFASSDDPIVIGVLGFNPFGEVLEKTVRGLKSQGRPIEVRQVQTADEAARCQVVFIARRQEHKEADWLRALQNKPVLTVTESAPGLASGAVLTLFFAKDPRGETKVAFSASLPAAREAGLQISASMLASARKVYREPAQTKAAP